jgi:hypothetical protein
VNVELESSFRRFFNNIAENQDVFYSLIEQCLQKNIDLEVALWTKLPLQPEIANRFHWLQYGESIKPNGYDASEYLLDAVKEIKENFEEITKNMKKYCKNKRGKDSIKWYVENYEKKQKQRKPMSSCVLRIRHLIKREEVIKMNKEELIKRIANVSEQFLALVEFDYKEN